jgi:hypothetical protein
MAQAQEQRNTEATPRTVGKWAALVADQRSTIEHLIALCGDPRREIAGQGEVIEMWEAEMLSMKARLQEAAHTFAAAVPPKAA